MERIQNRRHPWAGVLVALVVVLGASLLPSSPAAAGAGMAVGPSFPTSVIVGQTDIPASITLTNNNTEPEIASMVCRHDDQDPGPFAECAGAGGIVLTPSCGAQSPIFVVCTAPGADPEVFQINPVGTGSDACVGITFTAVPLNDAFGNYRFDPPPGVHVVLPTPGSACTISFTFNVLRMPTLDRQTAVEGIQTAQIAVASVQADTGSLGSGQGTTTPVTVQQAVPLISTTASSGFVVGGGQLSDVADVSGLVGDPAGSTVTFRLYGPADPTCTGIPVFVDTQLLLINEDSVSGSAQSGPFTPTLAGTYRWIATYDGNVDNASVSGTCGDVTETTAVAQATPGIETVASPDAALGAGQLSDMATVSGRVNPVGAQTVTFQLFGPADPECDGPPVFTSTVALVGDTATSEAYSPVDVGVHRWIATYNGDLNNQSASGACGDDGESHAATQAQPAIVTEASAGVSLGTGQLSDTATVRGRVNPVGAQTVTFELFGPADPECDGPPVFTSTVALVGDTATSEPYSPVDVGVHRWIATYDGDTNNAPVSGGCDDAGETATVMQATPAIVTVASANVVVGAGQLSDTATVTGRVNPVGAQTVTFELFGPADPECADEPVFTSTVALVDDTATSMPYSPIDAGTYRWIATYDGDANNQPVSGACDDAGESSVVAQATPGIVTLASAGVALGAGQLSDMATVTGRVNPVGVQTVTFELFGPADPECVGPPVFSSTVPLVDGSATSAAYTPNDAGVHRWIATYDGDANNEPVSGACDDEGETADVTRASPNIATAASASVALGVGHLSDTATVTGRVNPVGVQTVTFELFGPADPECAGPPVFSSTVAMVGDVATSGVYAPPDVGTYRWIARYDGDTNNGAVSGACSDAGETATVTRASPAITTVASAGVTLGAGQLSDMATVTGRVNPTGTQTITFRLYGPTDTTCTSAPVFTNTVPFTDDSAQSAPYTPVASGTYRWIATYDGDVNNSPVSGRCGEPTETRTVEEPPATLPPTGTSPIDITLVAFAATAAGALLRKVGRIV